MNANPYESPEEVTDEPRPPSRLWAFCRAASVFIASSFLLWFFVAPLIAPTDVAPEGVEPVPAYLQLIQILICYGLPLLFAYAKYKGARLPKKPASQADLPS